MRRFTTVRGIFLLFPWVFVTMLLGSCSLKSPDETSHDNPLDPLNPSTGGDPYHLQVNLAEEGVALAWNPVEISLISGYRIYRSVDEQSFSLLAETQAESLSYVDATVEDGYYYRYYVVVRSGEHEGSSEQVGKPGVHTKPYITIDEGNDSTDTPEVTLTLRAFNAQSVRLANSADFSGIAEEPFVTNKTWTLLTGEGTKSVFVEVTYLDSTISPVNFDSIEPMFPSSSTIQIPADTLSSHIIPVALYSLHAQRVQLSLEPSFLGAEWIPLQDTVNFNLGTGAPEAGGGNDPFINRQRIDELDMDGNFELDATPYTIYARFENDFLVPSDPVHDNVVIHIVPGIMINGGDLFTVTRNVDLTLTAVNATRMAVDTSLVNLQIFPQWRDFSGSIPGFYLAHGAGVKVVYAIFANPAAESDVVSDSIYPAPINPTIMINNGDAFTASRSVLLDLDGIGVTRVQIANDAPPGENDPWMNFETPIDWELSTGPGEKTVFAQFENDFAIVEYSSDSILPSPIVPQLEVLPVDSQYINHHDVTLSLQVANVREMSVLEQTDPFTRVWQPWQPSIPFVLSDGDGWKRIYAWFRHDFLAAGPVIDSVAVDTRVSVRRFVWSSNAEEEIHPGDWLMFELFMANDNLGFEFWGNAEVEVDGWEYRFPLYYYYNGEYKVTILPANLPTVHNATVTAYFTDRAGNTIQPVISEQLLTFIADDP